MPKIYQDTYTPQYPDYVWSNLRSTLHGLLGKSHSRCAKAMGVSRATWIKWSEHPPRNPWMTYVLYHCCFIHMHGYTGKYGSKRWKQRSHVAKLMQGMKRHFDEFTPDISEIQAYGGCEKHLARLLCNKGMYFHDIRKPANAGGYSPRMLRIAAHRLGVKMTQVGFGDDNESWWEWPTDPSEY